MNGPTPGAVTGTTSYRAGSGLDWQERGACRNADPELFFGPDGERGNSNARIEREAAAKAVCGDCPVMLQCRRYGLDNREEHGVWGGLDEAEREAIWRESDPTSTPSPASGDAWKAAQEAATAAWSAQAERDRAEVIATVEHLVGAGADVERVARATEKSIGTLERYLYRAKRHDLVAQLKQAG